MTMLQKVYLLESVIINGNDFVKLFFKNSFDYIDGNYYHIV